MQALGIKMERHCPNSRGLPPNQGLCTAFPGAVPLAPARLGHSAWEGPLTVPSRTCTLQKAKPRPSVRGETGPGPHRKEVTGLGARSLAPKHLLFAPHPTDAWDPRNQGSPSSAVQMQHRGCLVRPLPLGQGTPIAAVCSMPPGNDSQH